MQHLESFSSYHVTNEGLKTWLATFLLLANMGMVPLSIKTADAQTKKDFVESLTDDKVDAAKFVDFMTGKQFLPFDEAWEEFEKEIGSSSSKDEVEKNLSNHDKKYTLTTAARMGSPYSVKELSNVDIDKFVPNNWVTDMAKVFNNNSEEPHLNKWIHDFEKKTSIEIMVLTIPELDGRILEDYAQNTFERIGIGKVGADNGILILIAKDDRKMRVHTGYGIEEYVTDYEARRMITKMQDNFKAGDFDGGVLEALEHVNSVMGGMSVEAREKWLADKAEADRIAAQEAWDDFVNFLTNASLLLLLGGIIVGPIVYFKRRAAKRRAYKAKTLELKGDIKETLENIESLRKTLPEGTDLKSDKVIGVINKLKKIAERETPRTQNSDDNEELQNELTDIKTYKNLLRNVLGEYRQTKRDIEKQIQYVEGNDNVIASALRTTDSYISAYNAVLGYGYSTSKPIEREKFLELKSKGEAAKKLLSTNIDKAISDDKNFRQEINRLLSVGRIASNKLNDIVSAEKENKNAKSLIDSAIRKAKRWDKWAERGEMKEMETLKGSFFAFAGKESDKEILKINKKLGSVIAAIVAIGKKWSDREDDYQRKKREERRRREREERRKREAAAAAERARRARSYSSSSSSGGFGGFGGGSSGGGGASGGW